MSSLTFSLTNLFIFHPFLLMPSLAAQASQAFAIKVQMPAPAVTAVRVPFYYSAPPPSDDDSGSGNHTLVDNSHDATQTSNPVFITNVSIEVVAFGERFFWLHVSENPNTQHVPRFGACSVSVGLALHAANTSSSVQGSEDSSGKGKDTALLKCNATRSTSTSALLEFEAARPQDVSAGTNTTVQSVFASGLSQKLARGVAKRFDTAVTVYVNCAIEGERCLALLGTDGGSGFDMTFQFGALVYREALALMAKHLECVKGE